MSSIPSAPTAEDRTTWMTAVDAAIAMARVMHGEDEGIDKVWRYVGLRIVGGSEMAARPPHKRSLGIRRDIPRAIERAVLERDGGKCVECGSGAFLSIDHIIPVFEGGTNVMDNLRTLCQSCNESKGPRALHKPDEEAPWYRKEQLQQLIGISSRTIDHMVRRGEVARKQEYGGVAWFQPLYTRGQKAE